MKAMKLTGITLAAVLFIFALVQFVTVSTEEPVSGSVYEKSGESEATVTSEKAEPVVAEVTTMAQPEVLSAVTPAPLEVEEKVTFDHLVITGAMINAEKPDSSMAIIRVNNGKEMMVPVGSEIEPGVVLESVEFRHVIIKYKDKLVRLNFKKGNSKREVLANNVSDQQPAQEETGTLEVASDSQQAPVSSPLKVASQAGDIEKMREIIQLGADVNEKDSTGASPVMYSVFKGDIEAVKLLITSGANLEAENYDWTPLKIATVNRNWEMVELLKLGGATK